jgi:hypothetical protein
MNYAKLLGWGDYLAGIVKTVIFDEMQELRRDESQAGVQTAKYQAACMVADEASFTMEPHRHAGLQLRRRDVQPPPGPRRGRARLEGGVLARVGRRAPATS